MTRRAWTLPRASVAIAALVCLALSTQFLFQRGLYRDWSAADIAGAWLRGFVDQAIIAAAVLLALAVAGRVPASRGLPRTLLFWGGVLSGAALGEWAALWLQWGAWPTASIEAILLRALRWLPLGVVAGAILIYRQRTNEIAARLHDAEVARLQLEQQTTATQLQVLQAQVEPHFLFNTLATIRRLHQTDPGRGRETLANFIHYMQSALPEMRARETTLGREADLIAAYLDVLHVRMGDRLDFEIDVPAALRERAIPPLSIATLVENAIKHGLAGLPEGGRLSITATIEADRLVVRVADTGVGLTTSGGTGMGLANLRLRLRSLYGAAGVLTLTPNEPRGLVATLRVPASGSRLRDDRDAA